MATIPLKPSDEIGRERLTPLVQAALNDPSALVIDFQCRSMYSFQSNTCVYIYNGCADSNKGKRDWSLVLKVIKEIPGSDDPNGIWYWKREALAYQTGLLDELPGNIRGPRLYASEEHADGQIWLWMETIEDQFGTWPLEYFGEAARILGRFNGAYLAGTCPLPQQAWIPRNWLRQYVENAASMIEFIRENPRHPVVLQVTGGGLREILLALWDERHRLLDRLEAMPQALIHQDAFRGNLFAQPGELVAIDWAYMGLAPAGAELVPLVSMAMGKDGLPLNQVKALDKIAFHGYIHGLREAGWRGSVKEVRLAYCLTLWLRYAIGGEAGEVLPVLLDQEHSQAREEKSGLTNDEWVKSAQDASGYYGSILIEGALRMGIGYIIRIVTGYLKARPKG